MDVYSTPVLQQANHSARLSKVFFFFPSPSLAYVKERLALQAFCKRPFSYYLKPLFQYQANCKAIDTKTIFTLMQIKHIFARKILLLHSFWKGGFLELGNFEAAGEIGSVLCRIAGFSNEQRQAWSEREARDTRDGGKPCLGPHAPFVLYSPEKSKKIASVHGWVPRKSTRAYYSLRCNFSLGNIV